MGSGYRHVRDEELVAKIDRELTGRQLADVNAHLASCQDCRARADHLLSTALDVRMALRSVDDPARDPAARQRLTDALSREAGPSPASPIGIWRASLVLRPVLAVAAMVVGAFLLTSQQQEASPELNVPVRALPMARVTPGAVSSLSAAQLCAGEEPSRVVAAPVARQVLRAYGMEHVPSAEYELDALVTPELGGTVAAGNLWPQRYNGGVWNAYVKDEIENHLRDLVCSGRLELAVAQHEIATDWIAAYQRYFQRDQPTRVVRAEADEPELIIATGFADLPAGFRIAFTNPAATLE